MQVLNQPVSDFERRRTGWLVHESEIRSGQQDSLARQQVEPLANGLVSLGWSNQSNRPTGQFMSIEEQHKWWQQSAASQLAQNGIERAWAHDALDELKHIDEEVTEDSLPLISADAKEEAERIVIALSKYSIPTTIYPSVDGEIAIYFKPPDTPSSVLILVGNDGQAACFSCIKGKNRRARYEDSTELPDEFVKEQLQALRRRVFTKFI